MRYRTRKRSRTIRGYLFDPIAHELDHLLALGQVIRRHRACEFCLDGQCVGRIRATDKLHGGFELLRESVLGEAHGFVAHPVRLAEPGLIGPGYGLDG
jgi:hypothetical protein